MINDYISKIYFDDLYPDLSGKIAVKDTNSEYTYHDLELLADSIETILLRQGIKRQDIVGIYMENCMEFIASALACMRLSAIFVPFASTNPYERNRKIFDGCKPKFILSKKANTNSSLQFYDSECSLILVDELDVIESDDIHPRIHSLEDIAYIIYTSGSTGEPKGVAIRTESVINYIYDTIERLGFSEDLVTLNMTSFSFDGALTGIFCFLFCRGKIVIRTKPFLRPQKYFKYLCDEGITDIGCSPIQLEMLANALECTENSNSFCVKTIAVGGEELPCNFVEKILKAVPTVRILNRYGPTETTIVASSFDVTLDFLQSEFTSIPIGKPIKNVLFKVIREDGTLAGVNEAGELYIGGIQVMHSYWNDDMLTNEYIETDEEGIRWYKTKDLVQINSNGEYEFLGRKDDMVKIYGNRIYLSEVEHALTKLDYVKYACCFVSEDRQGNKQLVAVITSEIQCDEVTIKALLQSKIPKYMIPHRIIQIDEFPSNTSGKIDRNELRRLI